MAEKDRVIVKNHQGLTRNVEPIDLSRWARKGFYPETEKEKPEKEKKKFKK